MSLMLPRLIDNLLGKVNRSGLALCPGSAEGIPEFVELVRKAEKFSFNTIPLEMNPDPATYINGRPIWIQPQITQVEHEAWDAGLIPLPAPVCWYEFTLGSEASGLLVIKNDQDIKVQRVDYNPKTGCGVFTGLWVRREFDLNETLILQDDNYNLPWMRRTNESYYLSGSEAGLEFARVMRKKQPKGLNFTADHYLSVYLTLMLYSSSTEFKQEDAPAKLNKARVRSGHEPLPPHRIVTIVPGRYLERKDAQGGTHASPRLHWRRSHKRHFDRQTGNAKWLSNEVYRGQTGWYVTIVPRCLVGLAELGEVSHEYRVQQPEKDPVA